MVGIKREFLCLGIFLVSTNNLVVTRIRSTIVGEAAGDKGFTYSWPTLAYWPTHDKR